jgi:hypothetical protein
MISFSVGRYGRTCDFSAHKRAGTKFIFNNSYHGTSCSTAQGFDVRQAELGRAVAAARPIVRWWGDEQNGQEQAQPPPPDKDGEREQTAN